MSKTGLTYNEIDADVTAFVKAVEKQFEGKYSNLHAFMQGYLEGVLKTVVVQLPRKYQEQVLGDLKESFKYQ